MSIKELALHLQDKGRFGDTVLMHVNPVERDALAMLSPTGKLTRNPETGLEEAFLPMIAPVIGGLAGASMAGTLGISAALASGIGSGLASYATTGDLAKGIMSGIGAYGMGSFMGSVAGAGADAAAGAAAAPLGDAGASSIAATIPNGASLVPGAAAATPGAAAGAAGTPFSGPVGSMSGAGAGGFPASTVPVEAITAPPSAAMNAGLYEPGFMDKLSLMSEAPAEAWGQAALDNALPLGIGAISLADDIAGMQGAGPEDDGFERTEYAPYSRSVNPRGPRSRDTGEHDWFDSAGYVPKFADGGTVDDDEHQYVINNPNTVSGGGYAMNNVGGAGAGLFDFNPTNRAADGYNAVHYLDIDNYLKNNPDAAGDPFGHYMEQGFAKGQLPDENMYWAGTPNPTYTDGNTTYTNPTTQNPPTGDDGDDTVDEEGGTGLTYGDAMRLAMADSIGLDPMELSGGQQMRAMYANSLFNDGMMAVNQEVADEWQSNALQGLDLTADFDPENANFQRIMRTYGKAGQDRSGGGDGGGKAAGGLVRKEDRFAEGGKVGKTLTPEMLGEALDPNAPINDEAIVNEAILAIKGQSENPNEAIARFLERFGPEAMEDLIQQVDSGLLDDPSETGEPTRGPGDGMSDDIEAVGDNGRPMRLSDGEFVIPADVVSDLGNGSTEAGAAELEAFQDRVRMLRRGTTKQAPPLKAGEVLPA